MSVRRVWIAQALCPARHCIAATVGEAKSRARAEGLIKELQGSLDRLLARGGGGNPWCGICGADRETWHIELGRTRWRSMKEAEEPLADNHARQVLTAAILGTHGPQKPGRA